MGAVFSLVFPFSHYCYCYAKSMFCLSCPFLSLSLCFSLYPLIWQVSNSHSLIIWSFITQSNALIAICKYFSLWVFAENFPCQNQSQNRVFFRDCINYKPLDLLYFGFVSDGSMVICLFILWQIWIAQKFIAQNLSMCLCFVKELWTVGLIGVDFVVGFFVWGLGVLLYKYI